jgi:drug/metabolite transporter (DMT)-like permease
VPEWPNGAVSKIAVGSKPTGGSNPSLAVKGLAMSYLTRELKPYFEKSFMPLIDIISKAKVHPNFLTVFGLFLVAVGSYFLYLKAYLLSFVFLLLGALCDALDGAIARKTKRNSRLGFELKVGFFERTERWVVLLAGILLQQIFLALIILAVGSFLTLIQRVYTFMKLSQGR